MQETETRAEQRSYQKWLCNTKSFSTKSSGDTIYICFQTFNVTLEYETQTYYEISSGIEKKDGRPKNASFLELSSTYFSTRVHSSQTFLYLIFVI